MSIKAASHRELWEVGEEQHTKAKDMSALHLLHKERSANQGNPKHFFPQ